MDRPWNGRDARSPSQSLVVGRGVPPSRPGRAALRRGRMESRRLGGGLTGKAAILAALQPPALHHRISQSPVVGTAFHRRPVGRGVPPSRQVGSRVPRDRVCRRQSAPRAQTIPEPNCLTPNRPCRGTFRKTSPHSNKSRTKGLPSRFICRQYVDLVIALLFVAWP